MTVETEALHRIALALIVVLIARVVARGAPGGLWAFCLYALAGIALAVLALLGLDRPFEVGVLTTGVAAVCGVYWASASQPARKARWTDHVRALGWALAVALALGLLAVVYRWWVSPLFFMAMLTLALAYQGGWSLLLAWRPGKGLDRAVAQAAATALPEADAEFAAALRPVRPEPRFAPLVHDVRCRSCGLAGKVPASRAGQTLACPRCKAPVVVPGGPAKPIGVPARPNPAPTGPSAGTPSPAKPLPGRGTAAKSSLAKPPAPKPKASPAKKR